jgi:hypothetical protein
MLGGFPKWIRGQHRREALEASGNGRRAATPSQSGAVMAHVSRRFRVARVTLAAFHPVGAAGGGRNAAIIPTGHARYLAFQMAEVAI